MVNNLIATSCSGRIIPTVGLGYHWGDVPTFIKESSLYSDYKILLHTVDISHSDETSERLGSQ